jgi:hypothetical protein
MRFNPKILLCLAAGLSFGWCAQAVVDDPAASYYRGIPQRNIFGLKPPVAAPQPTAPPVALPKLVLTGITTILDNKRALLKVLPPSGAGQPAKEVSLILTEGQREEGVQVLEINERVGSVKVNNSGSVMTLTFEKDGPKLQNVPGLPGALPSLPGAPAYVPSATGRPGSRTAPGRALPMPGLSAGTTPAGVNPAAAAGLSVTANPNPPIATPDLTAEEVAIIQELEREANREVANPAYPTPSAAPSTPGINSQANTLIRAPSAAGVPQGQMPVPVPQ